jgi:hypothetical protein
MIMWSGAFTPTAWIFGKWVLQISAKYEISNLPRLWFSALILQAQAMCRGHPAIAGNSNGLQIVGFVALIVAIVSFIGVLRNLGEDATSTIVACGASSL